MLTHPQADDEWCAWKYCCAFLEQSQSINGADERRILALPAPTPILLPVHNMWAYLLAGSSRGSWSRGAMFLWKQYVWFRGRCWLGSPAPFLIGNCLVGFSSESSPSGFGSDDSEREGTEAVIKKSFQIRALSYKSPLNQAFGARYGTAQSDFRPLLW